MAFCIPGTTTPSHRSSWPEAANQEQNCEHDHMHSAGREGLRSGLGWKCFWMELLQRCTELRVESRGGESKKINWSWKWQFCLHLLTLKLFQIYMTLFLLQNTKVDILRIATVFVLAMKVSGVQNNTGFYWLSLYEKKKMKKNLNNNIYIFLCFTGKVTQVFNNMQVCKCFNFWVFSFLGELSL